MKYGTPYWWDVMDKARARIAKGRPPFTQEEVCKARQWPTCACGKQDAAIARFTSNGAPIDKVLRRAGMRFFYQIVEGSQAGCKDPCRILLRAESSLRAVERRAAVVIEQHTAVTP